MKFSYKFSSLLGSVYHKGNVAFSKDGNSIISPVGNRISIYDLKSNKSSTLPVESRFNYTALDISPDGSMLISANEVGEIQVISLISNSIIYSHSVKFHVFAIKFSPNGKFFAACKGNRVVVFRVPGQFGKEFNPFIIHRTFYGATADVVCIDWTTDSKVIIVGSQDGSARLYSLARLTGFRICSLSSHNEGIIGVFFEKNSLDCYTICSGGRLCVWEASKDLSDLTLVTREAPKESATNEEGLDTERGEEAQEVLENAAERKKSDEEEMKDENETELLRFKLISRNYLKDHVKAELKCASYHSQSEVLVAGFANGSFLILELPDVNIIHSLSISSNPIDQVSFNITGDWIAIASEAHGQLVVWEWQSETYIMNQQGHSSTIASLSYSPDGQLIVTGGVDGNVKLWNTVSGFCFKTFDEHTAPVAAVRFSRNKKFVVSASLDGSVRCFDLARYRNFRTFTANKPVQFFSLAIDSSCDFVAAGGQNVFEIFLWSIKIGKLVEILSGHEAPVPCLDFSPNLASSELASVSWDKTLRIWNAVEATTINEAIRLFADATCVAYRPDGKEVAVSTLDGQICTFDVATATQTNHVSGRNDLGSGRNQTDLVSAKKTLQAKAFLSVSYSPDGTLVLSAGQSKNICLYSIGDTILLKKFVVTQNRSLDSVDDFINRRKMTEFGNMSLIEEREEGYAAVKLPGVTKGDMAARKTKPEIRVFALQFSPTGQEWAAATTEGLLVYSLAQNQIFDPFHLKENITVSMVQEVKKERRFGEALMMALRLNEKKLIREVLESVPPKEIPLTVTTMPEIYTEKLLEFVSITLDKTQHLEFYLMWLKEIFSVAKKPNKALLVLIQRSLQSKYKALSKVSHYNRYTLEYLKERARIKIKELPDLDEEDIWNASFSSEDEEMEVEYGKVLELGSDEEVAFSRRKDGSKSRDKEVSDELPLLALRPARCS